jgi:hypothetical protein
MERCDPDAEEGLRRLWRVISTEPDPAQRQGYLGAYYGATGVANTELSRLDTLDGVQGEEPYTYNADSLAARKRQQIHPYLSPSGIRLYVAWRAEEPDTAVAAYMDRFLDAFEPVRPAPEVSPAMLLDSLSMLVDTTAAYAWVRPTAFADTLRARAAAARTALALGNETAAQAALTQFQSDIEAAYESPVPGVREATREGHRFLWWTAQYLLDRLE